MKIKQGCKLCCRGQPFKGDQTLLTQAVHAPDGWMAVAWCNQRSGQSLAQAAAASPIRKAAARAGVSLACRSGIRRTGVGVSLGGRTGGAGRSGTSRSEACLNWCHITGAGLQRKYPLATFEPGAAGTCAGGAPLAGQPGKTGQCRAKVIAAHGIIQRVQRQQFQRFKQRLRSKVAGKHCGAAFAGSTLGPTACAAVKPVVSQLPYRGN